MGTYLSATSVGPDRGTKTKWEIDRDRVNVTVVGYTLLGFMFAFLVAIVLVDMYRKYRPGALKETGIKLVNMVKKSPKLPGIVFIVLYDATAKFCAWFTNLFRAEENKRGKKKEEVSPERRFESDETIRRLHGVLSYTQAVPKANANVTNADVDLEAGLGNGLQDDVIEVNKKHCQVDVLVGTVSMTPEDAGISSHVTLIPGPAVDEAATAGTSVVGNPTVEATADRTPAEVSSNHVTLVSGIAMDGATAVSTPVVEATTNGTPAAEPSSQDATVESTSGLEISGQDTSAMDVSSHNATFDGSDDCSGM
ncbi:hypothetical protein G7046_g8505 [Stylonectria norvegica]|nr:hypothetical protein G7046_g8505 [Stylonectria norvegica]